MNVPIADLEHERRIYEQIGRHPCVLEYKGCEKDSQLILRRMKHGSLAEYLETQESRPSFDTRVQWAIDVAHGVGHLHSCGVLWCDGHMGNILVAADPAHAVICDFNNAHIWPATYCSLRQTVSPPLLIPSWLKYRAKNVFAPDIFALTGIVFFLLTWRFPCAPHAGLTPFWTEEEFWQLSDAHAGGNFEELDVDRFGPLFAEVVHKGFRIEYATATGLGLELEHALGKWKAAFAQGLVSDPDAAIVEHPPPASLVSAEDGQSALLPLDPAPPNTVCTSTSHAAPSDDQCITAILLLEQRATDAIDGCGSDTTNGAHGDTLPEMLRSMEPVFKKLLNILRQEVCSSATTVKGDVSGANPAVSSVLL